MLGLLANVQKIKKDNNMLVILFKINMLNIILLLLFCGVGGMLERSFLDINLREKRKKTKWTTAVSYYEEIIKIIYYGDIFAEY